MNFFAYSILLIVLAVNANAQTFNTVLDCRIRAILGNPYPQDTININTSSKSQVKLETYPMNSTLSLGDSNFSFDYADEDYKPVFLKPSLGIGSFNIEVRSSYYRDSLRISYTPGGVGYLYRKLAYTEEKLVAELACKNIRPQLSI